MKYNKEVRTRIRLSVAAYAYEVLNESIMSDADFDALAKSVDLSIDTGNELLDNFFREHFDPSTGVWVLKHPEKSKLLELCKLIRRSDENSIR